MEETLKQIKKLDKESKRTVTDKKIALATFQQGQITRLLDDLGSKEFDPNFEWSLVQIDPKIKPVSSTRGTNKKSLYETVTMTVYVKRAPNRDLNAVQLYHNLERIKADRLRPPPPPPPQQHQQPQPQQIRPPPPQQHQQQQGGGGNPQQGQNRIPPPPGGAFQLNKNGPAHGIQRPQIMKQQQKHPQQKGGKTRAAKKYHRKYDSSSDVSSSGSSGSDGSDSESDGNSSITSASSKAPRRNSKGPTRKQSFRRESHPKYYLEARASSPHRHRASDDFGGISTQHRPYAPDVPRLVPGIDPITSAYQAGKQDAIAERFGDNRFAQQPPQIIQPVIERIIEPRPVESFRRVEPQYAALPRRIESRRIEPRYHEERYAADDFRSAQDDMIVRQREAEDHMERLRIVHDRRPIELNRRPDSRDFLERRNTDFDSRPLERPDFFDRRYSDIRPLEHREARPEYFGRPTPGRAFQRDISPRRAFSRDDAPFSPIPLQRRYPDTSSSSSSFGW